MVHKNVPDFGAELYNTQAEVIQTKCIFSKQTFMDTCTEIQVDISYFNQDTKQNSATCQMQKTTK